MFKKKIAVVIVSVYASAIALCSPSAMAKPGLGVSELLSGAISAQMHKYVQSNNVIDGVQLKSSDFVQPEFSQCKEFFPQNKTPVVPDYSQLHELCFSHFAVLYSGQTKTPIFTVERLNRQRLAAAKGVKRIDNFYEEARLPGALRARLSDYKGSGFDRGHMAPAGDMFNTDAMSQSFSLANIVPQNAKHNRGIWAKIESDTRKYIQRAKGDVFVFTGPVYANKPIKTIGNGVAVPDIIFKLVYDATTDRAWVHWHENAATVSSLKPISYAEFVDRTGLYLLPAD